MAKMNKEKRVGLRLYENQLQDLEILAKKNNSSISEQVREAVEEYVLNQGVRNSLSYIRRQIKQKTTFEKLKLIAGLVIIALLLPVLLDIKIDTFRRVAMAIGIILGTSGFLFNIDTKYWLGILTIGFGASFVLPAFFFSPSYQLLFGTFFIWLSPWLLMFILLHIGLKEYETKINKDHKNEST
ncbi:ribbon-helix-helix domain-containing protein [bacterium]|nr:ribbon-helix-helix domain-containing protein [bacterium]